jgi:chromosome partitioning protein
VALKPLGAVAPVIEAGGLFAYARTQGMMPGKAATRPARPGRVIAIANQKGGVGKTTTVINLAACLARRRQRLLVVDLDPQANATSGLGLPQIPGASLYKVLLGEGSILDLVRPAPIKGIDVVPSEIDLAGCEVEVARLDRYLHCLQDALQPALETGRYDYVLVDCPPSLGVLTMNALAASDAIVIPMQCEYYALEGLSVISRLVQQLREAGANRHLEIEGILMTMYDSRTRLSEDVVAEVRKHFGDLVYKTVIPRNVRLSEAPSFGQPIIDYARRSSGSKAYLSLAKEFLRRARRRDREPPQAENGAN